MQPLHEQYGKRGSEGSFSVSATEFGDFVTGLVQLGNRSSLPIILSGVGSQSRSIMTHRHHQRVERNIACDQSDQPLERIQALEIGTSSADMDF